LEGRTAIGHDHGYDAQLFYLGLALDPAMLTGGSTASETF
jgi:hypothetical protein